MNYLKSVFTKVQNGFLIAAGACVIVGLILSLIGSRVAQNQKAQNLAKRWSKDNDCAQVSVFFSELAGVEVRSIQEMEYRISDALEKDSHGPKNSNARVALYSFCANGSLTVQSNKASVSVKAVGIDGDFFMFHPLEIINGAYFDGDDLLNDKVVIDRDIAWQLFGSTDVVGQVITISGNPYVICGVIERDTGRINDLSGNNKPTIYVSYDVLSEYGSVEYINTFEALLPNPVTGYAKGLVKDVISADESRYELVENTGRFHWTKLVQNVKSFGTRGMNMKAIVFPYWENVARGVEDYLTPIAVIGVILFGFAAIVLIVLVIRMYQKRTIHLKNIKNLIERCMEKQRYKRSIKKREKENEKSK